MQKVKANLTHRQRQALATRQLILGAAKELFLEHGYATTTIEAIAEKAGVAVSTVYAAFRSKRGVLKGIREAWHEQSDVRALYQQGLSEGSAERLLELFAHATRRQWEAGAALLSIYTGAATANPDAAEELREALAGRRRSTKTWLARAGGIFRSELTAPQVHATYLALTLPEVYRELVEVGGWTPAEYEAWLADSLKAQLLRMD